MIMKPDAARFKQAWADAGSGVQHGDDTIALRRIDFARIYKLLTDLHTRVELLEAKRSKKEAIETPLGAPAPSRRMNPGGDSRKVFIDDPKDRRGKSSTIKRLFL